MSAPQRIQRRRTKGWRAPEGAVYVGRGTRWGNGWAIHQGGQDMDFRWVVGAGFEKFLQTKRFDDIQVMTFETRHEAATYAVKQYEKEMSTILGDSGALERQLRTDLATLAGKDLMCWCPRNQPCHADVLLELANQETLND